MMFLTMYMEHTVAFHSFMCASTYQACSAQILANGGYINHCLVGTLVDPLLAQKLAMSGSPNKIDKTIGKLLRSILTNLTGNWDTILVDHQMPVDIGGNLKRRPQMG
jgi:hypothetical protein